MPSSAIIPASCDTPVEQSVTCRFNGQLFFNGGCPFKEASEHPSKLGYAAIMLLMASCQLRVPHTSNPTAALASVLPQKSKHSWWPVDVYYISIKYT
jgi:hypothetical protein